MVPKPICIAVLVYEKLVDHKPKFLLLKKKNDFDQIYLKFIPDIPTDKTSAAIGIMEWLGTDQEISHYQIQ